MLDAILFVIRSVGSALAIYLAIPVPFTTGVTLNVYWIIVFLFAISVFWKLIEVLITQGVSTPVIVRNIHGKTRFHK